ALLAELLADHPRHPDLLRLEAERLIAGDDPEAARQAVMRYAAARPVDPWPHRVLVPLATQTGRHAEARASLEYLDSQEQQTGAWAHQLARSYQSSNRLDQAAYAIGRALHREP